MHRLSKVEITNFKSVDSANIELASYTPIVGYNNAGKTNFLLAIQWLLRKSVLDEDFYFDRSQPISVTGEIKGITEELLATLSPAQRRSIEPYIADETLLIRRTQSVGASRVSDIRLFVRDLAAEEEQWNADPNGVEAAIRLLFPEPIFVEAMSNAADDVGKFAKSSTIGRLLQDFIQPLQDAAHAQLTTALASIQSVLSAEGEQKAEVLSDADSLLSREVESFFPGVELKIDIPSPNLDGLLKSGTIRVYDAGAVNGRGVEHMGHGAQRSIQMALIKCLAERKSRGAHTTTLLLVDEPELYLHPQAIAQTRTALKQLALLGYQVAFTTHSPLLIELEDIPNTLIITKATGEASQVRTKLKESLAKLERKVDTNIELLFSLDNSSQFLFADQIVLVEGVTERRLFPHLARLQIGQSLDAIKVAVIEVLGSTALVPVRNVLHDMGYPVKIVADLDFVFKIAPNFGLLEADDEDLLECKKVFRQMSDVEGMPLDDSGCPKSDKSVPFKAEEGYRTLASFEGTKKNLANLCGKLRAMDCWIWTKGTIEDHLGLEGKKPAHHRNFISKLNEQGIEESVTDAEAIKELFEWITP